MYRRSGSTTPSASDGKITPGRRGQKRVARRASIPGSCIQPASARTPVTVTLTFMSGAEPWVRIVRDGHHMSMPATIEVWELILFLNGWHSSR